jgi:hypothetical protein
VTPQIIGQSEAPTDTTPLPDGAVPVPDGEQAPEKPAFDKPVEVGGRKGPDPVRYGDWEKNGRCIDF